MIVCTLYRATSCLPDLDLAVLRASHHPFPLAMEGDARNVARVAFKCEHRCGVGGLDVVKLDGMMACSSEVAFVGGDTQSIDLRVGMLNCTRANARKRFPEAYGVVVPRCSKKNLIR